MLKRLMFIGLTCFASGIQAEEWQSAIKQSIDTTQHMPLLANGTVAPSDLNLDGAFGLGGKVAFWPSTAPGETATEDGLRVFAYRTCSHVGSPPVTLCMHSGYYVAGRQKLSNGSWQGRVTRIKLNGTVDTTFADNGWATIQHVAAFETINDFALLGNKLYMAATGRNPSGRFFYVVCRDLSANSSCSGFGFLSASTQSFSTHGATDAVAQRIAADNTYGLFTAGYVRTTRGWEIGIVRMNADTGAPVTEFRGDGLNVGLPSWAEQPNADIDVFDMAVAPALTPGGARLHLAGKIKVNSGDYDGYVLAVDPATSASISGWGPWKNFYFEEDNYPPAYKADAITAITVQRNGKLAMAGWSETSLSGDRRMLLARTSAAGTADAGFCGSGICLPVDSGILPTDDLPVAIAERAGHHDLVVALRANNVSLSDAHARQAVWQFSASGKTLHYEQVMDYTGTSDTNPWSRPFGMWVGNTGILGVGQEVVAVVGTRFWHDVDFDMTLSHLVASDSIFANQFGNPNSD